MQTRTHTKERWGGGEGKQEGRQKIGEGITGGRKKTGVKGAEGGERGGEEKREEATVLRLWPQEPRALVLGKVLSLNQLGLAPLSQGHGFTGPSLALEKGKAILVLRETRKMLPSSAR